MLRNLITKLRRSIVSGCLLALLVQSIWAQTTAFSYQGKLTDAAQPANGVYDLQFRLFDALVGGNQVGTTLIREDVSVNNGIFTVTLDFGATAFPGAQRFLEIGVRPGASTGVFTPLSPMQPLTATPYAIKSLSASNADALSALCNGCVSESKLAEGSVTDTKIIAMAGSKIIGTVPVASLPAGSSNYLQNTTTQQANANFNISGNGTIGATLVAGSVGIGTTSPRAALDVTGNAVQDLSTNGFVKAMAFVTVTQTPQGQLIPTVTRCFNGSLNSSSGNCGFTVQASDFPSSLRIRVNFGFTVDNRFVSFNELDDPGNTALNTVVGRIAFFDSTTVQVVISRNTSKVFIFVY